MTIREPISEAHLIPEASYGSLLQRLNDEHNLEAARHDDTTDNLEDGNEIREAQQKELPDLPYEICSSRCEVLVTATVTVGFIIACTWGLLFGEKPETIEDKTDVIFVCIFSFFLAPCTFLSVLRWRVLIEDHGVTCCGGFRTKFVPWDDMDLIGIRVTHTPLTTVLHMHIFGQHENCLLIENRAKRLEHVINLVYEKKPDLFRTMRESDP